MRKYEENPYPKKTSPYVHQVSDPSLQQYDNATHHAHVNKKVESVTEWTSHSIVVLFCLFFLLVASFYLYSRINFHLGHSEITGPESLADFDFQWDELAVPLCRNVRDGEPCINSSDRIKPALLVLRYILYHIEKGLIEYYCSSGVKEKDATKISTNELRNAIRLNAAEINEKLKLLVPGVEDVEPKDHFLPSHYFDDAIVFIQTNPSLYLTYHNTDSQVFIHVEPEYPIQLPFDCRISRLIWKTGQATIVGLVFLTIFGSLYWLRASKKRRIMEDDNAVKNLVDKCLQMLQSPDAPMSTPITDLRDTLLSPPQRKDKRWKNIWSRVVEHVEKNEARVKICEEEINGEEFRTWKWCGDYLRDGLRSPIGVYSNQNKTPNINVMKTGTIEWQGSAFGPNARCGDALNDSFGDGTNCVEERLANGSKSTYNNFVAPTRFLKVRNMCTEESKNNPNQQDSIYNAIVEKCSYSSRLGHHGIQHIHISHRDSADSPVYIKCDSIESASTVYEALHGQWCERKLVSVKFLKEDRYFQRFPEARNMQSLVQKKNSFSNSTP